MEVEVEMERGVVVVEDVRRRWHRRIALVCSSRIWLLYFGMVKYTITRDDKYQNNNIIHVID